MGENLNTFPDKMTALRHVSEVDGKRIEFWSAREIQPEFGYDRWENFHGVIEKAIENCSKINADPRQHFAAVKKMIPIGDIGKGAMREQRDYVLSRTGCYLLAVNGDPSKKEIAWAKAYFVAQTQKREQERALADAEERSRLRGKLKDANKQLAGTAKAVGVKNFAFFNDAGIRGLYGGLHLSELRAKKGIAAKDDYWDNVSSLELSANEFKAQLARQNLSQRSKTGKCGQQAAEEEHMKAGKAVRHTVLQETKLKLEDVPAQPSLKKLLREWKKNKKNDPTLPAPSSSEPEQPF